MGDAFDAFPANGADAYGDSHDHRLRYVEKDGGRGVNDRDDHPRGI